MPDDQAHTVLLGLSGHVAAAGSLWMLERYAPRCLVVVEQQPRGRGERFANIRHHVTGPIRAKMYSHRPEAGHHSRPRQQRRQIANQNGCCGELDQHERYFKAREVSVHDSDAPPLACSIRRRQVRWSAGQ